LPLYSFMERITIIFLEKNKKLRNHIFCSSVP